MGLTVTNLKLSGLYAPEFFDETPEFGWALNSDDLCCVQKAYRISLRQGESLIWDTGKVDSGECVGIVYTGEKLMPFQGYTWNVGAWDNYGNYAEGFASFRTGRLDTPWTTSWVEPEQEPTIPEISEPFTSGKTASRQVQDYSNYKAVQFLRIPFECNGNVESAYVSITAHGLYRLELNGRKAGELELTPEFSPYQKLLMYQTYDVTSGLHSGKNVFSVILADGWWIGRIGLSGDNCQYGDRRALLLECRITYRDGTAQVFGAENGRASIGNIQYADLFVGERHDAAAEPAGWKLPQFVDGHWSPVKTASYPMDNLCGQIGEGVRVVRRLRPKAVFTTPDGDTILDVGQNIAGWIELAVDTGAGHTIVLEHSEVLDENGNYMCSVMGINKDQRDVYVTKEGRQTWRPFFTYHGFRYVRITGWPGTPSPEQFEACAISTPMEEIGEFICDDSRLNQLHSNIIWSQLANAVSIPTDCPQREKAGWTGDIMAYSPTMCFLSDAESFLRRWLRYCREEQLENGIIPMVVPYIKQYDSLAERLGSATSCGWGDAIVIVPWNMYQSTGNLNILRENYGAMKMWMAYVQGEAENGRPDGFDSFDERRKARQKYLWNTGFHFGDWLLPSIMMNTPNATPVMTALATKDIFAPAYYAWSTSLMSKVAEALEIPSDAEHYRELNQKITEAFIEEYVHEDGTLDANFQGIYVLCLKLGLTDEKRRPGMLSRLCELIAENNGCLDTGFLSIHFLLDALSENGRRDTAYDLLFQTRCPSWLYMVERGATTIWESWNCIAPDGKVGSYSYNHYAYGCVGSWIYREIGGLQAEEPGYKRIRICPGLDSGLKSVLVKHMTPYGLAKVKWSLDHSNRLSLETLIPVNTTATVALPAAKADYPSVLRKYPQAVLKDSWITIELGSGLYKIEAQAP